MVALSARKRPVTPAILATGTDRGPSLALAAAVAVEAAVMTGAGTLLIEVGETARHRRPTLLASPGARRIEDVLKAVGLRASARGHLCHLAVTGREPMAEAARAISVSEAELAVIHLPGRLWVPALEAAGLRAAGGCLLVSLPAERPLAALAVDELARRGVPARVASKPPGQLAVRRALAGVRAGGWVTEAARGIARRLLALGRPARDPSGPLEGRERGQAMPAVLGAGLILILAALALAAIGGAATGRGRVQRAADLAALSAARSMRDDVPRLLAPPRLSGGAPNPRHLSRGDYLSRARLAAVDAARRNRVDPARLRISFPDAAADPPLQARATVVGEIDPQRLPGGDRLGDRPPIRVEASAVAEASAPVSSWTGMPSQAEGGGYSGPLVYRDGEGVRPDVAVAYDRMAAAAKSAGLDLVVVSGFRSDAEQAELFARHPDPQWVAPPGHSLHRCATELDLGPSSAYGWLISHAPKFGFLHRYPWEPWHFGYIAGPPPCSEAGNAVLAGAPGEGDGLGRSSGVPSFVPAAYRDPLIRSAARWNVSPGLLAAQLMAESGFNPRAVSPAGALGIAQFIPSTARSYGLRDPFDPVASIDAQAHLMSDLLRRFHSVPLALAAYNAGSGAVAACNCVPSYPETRAYVARILALADGAGVLLSPPLEVRLVQ
ncbi:MAG TPA: transglycosylase SLT domain-containing protein [Solirubrobacterales bacterium]|nr:transglycosylase SLT domain-containing protein [Solirubrobacterales bacterium]